MKTFAILVIAACAFVQTFEVYSTEDGGTNIFFGTFGYHIAGP